MLPPGMDHLLHRFEPLDVLVLDDSRPMRALLRALLGDLGVGSVRDHPDAASAMADLRRRPADIVLADWVMPPPDGLAFTRALRALPDAVLRRTPVLMVTAHAEAWRVRAARDAGVTEFLAKPVAPRALAERLLGILDNPRPFVRSAGFTGPCRRRRTGRHEGPERRTTPLQVLLGRPEFADLFGAPRG
jgi:CheY-like chemotaxis protein